MGLFSVNIRAVCEACSPLFWFGRAIDKRIAGYQNELVERHCDEVQNIYKTMRGWRHDYHSHIQAMKVMAQQVRQEGGDCGALLRLEEYLDSLNDDLTAVDTVVKTGNVMVDAILNSKLSLIKARNIPLKAKAAVPAELGIGEVELCVIIGNLLDNAMESCLLETAGKGSRQKDVCQKDREGRAGQMDGSEAFIRIYIGVLKEQLYISVANSSYGKMNKIGKRYLSTKKSAGHGYGLMRIDRIVNKYHGYINRQNEEGAFVTEVMLPL